MKKMIFPIAIVAIASSTIFIACKKSGPEATDESKQTEVNWTLRGKAGENKITQTSCPKGGCHTPASDCVALKEVVIKAHRVSEMAVIGESGTASDVADYFGNDNNAELTANLDPEIKSKILSGQYYMALNYDGDNVCNFVFGTKFPVIAEESEFTLEYTKE